MASSCPIALDGGDLVVGWCSGRLNQIRGFHQSFDHVLEEIWLFDCDWDGYELSDGATRAGVFLNQIGLNTNHQISIGNERSR